MKGTTIDWALWAGAGITALSALMLLAWALWWDRSRGRKRCPKCWYAMEGVTAGGGLSCPECGHVAESERRLRRTRRRWRWAVAAVLLGMVSYGLAAAPGIRQRGWPSAIPSSVLVTVWPVSVKDWVAMRFDDQTIADPVLEELNTRIYKSKLRRWQSAWWRRRVERELQREGRFGIAAEEPVLRKLREKRVTRAFVADRLEDAARTMGEELGVKVVCDWKALEGEHLDADTKVSATMVDLNGEEALDALLGGTSADMLSPVWWELKGDEVRIGAWDPTTSVLPVCSYDLGPLVQGREGLWQNTDGTKVSLDDRVTRVSQVIMSLVQPESWVDNGGERGIIAPIGLSLLVRAPARTQVAMEDLFDAVRRGLEAPGETVAVEEDAWREIAATYEKLTGTAMTFREGSMSVQDLLARIGTEAGVTVDVEWQLLRSVRVSPELPVETVAATMNAAQALERYVERLVEGPLDGVSWTLRNGVVVVWPARELPRYKVVRMYNVDDLLTVGQPHPPFRNDQDRGSAWTLTDEACRGLINLIESTIDMEGWVDNGGESGTIRAFGTCLIVQTTPRNHLAIEELLGKMRAAQEKQAEKKDGPSGR